MLSRSIAALVGCTSAFMAAPRSRVSPAVLRMNGGVFNAMEAPLVPRDVLFGNPEYAAPSINPDGSMLAYLRPVDGVLNAWVRSVAGGDDRVVTKDSYRGIRQFFWAEDSKTLLYLQDDGGDENFHLFAIDATTPGAEARDLTPCPGAKAQNIITNKRFPGELLVAINERDKAQFDMYRCDLATGKLTLDTENPGGVVGWGSEDESFEVREGIVVNPDSSKTVKVRADKTSDWRDLATFPYGEEGGMVDFTADGEHCLMLSSVGRETTALTKVRLADGETTEVIASNDKCDCGGIMTDDDTKEVRAVSFNYARTERTFFDESLKKHFDALEALAPPRAEVSLVSKTRDEKTWVVSFRRDDGPAEYHLYDAGGDGALTKLFVSQPALLDYEFAPMEDVRIRARDGLELVGYLTRAKAEGPTPLVLVVHGGPWARDFWGFNSAAQWFANRGYAVLQVNFRGSTGYGKSFLHKGGKEWGVGSMQHDLSDSVKWAVDQGIADPENVCIYGGSYGGYATLAGLTFTPELYKCGVDIVGPSNIKTLLDSIPPYWGPLRNDMLKKIGDVDEDTAFNEKISPLYHVDKIAAPLLIGQGANDPRVKQAEADQIAFSMADKGIPVEYVLYPDEGHGWARPPNRIDFNGRTELFLAEHLGGRSEPFTPPEGNTATFPLETRK